MYEYRKRKTIAKVKRIRNCIVVAIPVVFFVGIGISWLAGQGYIAIDPLTVIPSLIVVTLMLVLSVGSLELGAARYTIPAISTRMLERDGIVSRVLIGLDETEEHLIAGPPDMSVRESLRLLWPFTNQDPDSSWYVLDEARRDVTEYLLIDTKGTLTILFPNSK